MAQRLVKAVTLLGQSLVLFKDASGAWGLLDRDCAHCGADLSFGIMRGFAQPDIGFDNNPWGLQLTTLRCMTEALTHVCVTQAIFPATFVIPLSKTLTITQMHVPVNDTQTYWYSFFTSFAAPLDKPAMRAQR